MSKNRKEAQVVGSSRNPGERSTSNVAVFLIDDQSLSDYKRLRAVPGRVHAYQLYCIRFVCSSSIFGTQRNSDKIYIQDVAFFWSHEAGTSESCYCRKTIAILSSLLCVEVQCTHSYKQSRSISTRAFQLATATSSTKFLRGH